LEIHINNYSSVFVLGIGLITGLGLILGAGIGVYSNLKHTYVARVMSLGAGMLLSAAIVELVIDIFNKKPLMTGLSLLAGAVSFSIGNLILSWYNAKNRKRCGECVSQPSEEDAPNSGLAIALGTFMDAVPESLVLGMSLKSQGFSLPLLIAITIGNAPEAMSSSSGMKSSGRSIRWIFSLWIGLALASSLLTFVGYKLHELLNQNVEYFMQAFGAGAILSMICEVLLPEAAHDSPAFGGVIASLGFISILLFGFFY